MSLRLATLPHRFASRLPQKAFSAAASLSNVREMTILSKQSGEEYKKLVSYDSQSVSQSLIYYNLL